MGDWIGRANRESETMPILHFRKLLQSLGLLRKYKGTLRLTRAGAVVQQAREELWNFLADELPSADEGFDTDATLLLLVYAATSADAELPLDEVAAALVELGWRTGAGQLVDSGDLYCLRALEISQERHERAERVARGATGQSDRGRPCPRGAATPLTDGCSGQLGRGVQTAWHDRPVAWPPKIGELLPGAEDAYGVHEKLLT